MTFDSLEIFDFINDSKDQVRLLAVEGISGSSTDADFIQQVTNRPDLQIQLFQRVYDDNVNVSNLAWKALINLAREPLISFHLAEEVSEEVSSFICAAADIPAPDEYKNLTKNYRKELCIFGDFGCMLLSNLCKSVVCREKIFPFVKQFCTILLAKSQRCTFDFLCSVLADMTLDEECRRVLTEGRAPTFLKFTTYLCDGSLIRRGGVCTIIKNCLLQTDRHGAILDEFDDTLLSGLLGRLCGPQCEFSEKELDEMLVEISLEHRNSPAEKDPALKEMVLESLIALGTTFQGRAMMRKKQAYPIIREAHKHETDDHIRELMEKYVEYLIRDDGEENLSSHL